MLFLGSEKGAFAKFLADRISETNSESNTDDFLKAKLAPTKQLLALAADEIRNREQFNLLDEQQVAYSLVMKAVRDAESANTFSTWRSFSAWQNLSARHRFTSL
jgi:hypothetical protein